MVFFHNRNVVSPTESPLRRISKIWNTLELMIRNEVGSCVTRVKCREENNLFSTWVVPRLSLYIRPEVYNLDFGIFLCKQ